ncbi:MAG TPA: potassium channel family protein [Vicinamibacterales bacterium]|nr:potassium channel family protein [Vicinamibacterales bacterium]
MTSDVPIPVEPRDVKRPGASRAARAIEPVASFLAFLIIPALLIEARTTSAELLLGAQVINWVVWIVFCLEFALFFVAEPGWATVKRRWLDVAVIALSPPFLVPDALEAARSARLVRLVRLLRFVRVGILAAVGLRQLQRLAGHHRFHFVALVGAAVVVLGAFGVYLVEGDQNPAVGSIGNALWWAVVTATTVGYGDVSPVSTEGRLIAVVLMLAGIGVIGVFTATVASYFLEPEQAETHDVHARLEAIERKLDALLADRDAATRERRE